MDVDESPLPAETPKDTALRLAAQKARAAQPTRDEIVLAADTVVALDGSILGKPSTPEEAREMLLALRGRYHQVFTAVAVATAQRDPWLSVTETLVLMRSYSDEEVEAYISSRKPMDKAGGYGVQDHDFAPVASYIGCYLNVVGLPLCEVIRGLKAMDFPDANALSWEDLEPLCPTCRKRRQAGEKL